jgi:thiamine pyrophosphate-dependent acetolactate synthase large subunit-like protein
MRVSAMIAGAFRDEGVREVFGLLGNGNIEFVAHFMDLPDCRYRAVRHESAGVAAAEGFARVTGDVGVATCTMGPGLTHAATSLVTAARGRTPMVVFSGSTREGVHAMNEQQFVETCDCRWLPYERLADVAEAFFVARTQRVPVVLGVPLDLQERDAPPEAYLPRVLPRTPAVHPNAQDVSAAVDLLVASRSPIILAGRGALEAKSVLLEVADLLDASISTTLPVKGDLAQASRAIGTAGGYASDGVRREFERADCVLAVGTSLSRNTIRATAVLGTAVIHVDLEAGRRPVRLPIVADARLTLERIAAGLRERGLDRCQRSEQSLSPGEPVEPDLAQHAPAIEEGTLDARLVTSALDRALPDDAIIVTDSGHFHAFIGIHLGPGTARRFEIQNEFGAIGQGLGRAVGAAVAAPTRTVVCIAGDGGFMQTLPELDSVARHCPNLLVVVMNDGALGAEFHRLRAKGLDPQSATWPTPDLAAIARLFGMSGRRADSLADVERAVGDFLAGEGAALVDVPISRSVVSRPYRQQVLPVVKEAS